MLGKTIDRSEKEDANTNTKVGLHIASIALSWAGWCLSAPIFSKGMNKYNSSTRMLELFFGYTKLVFLIFLWLEFKIFIFYVV